MERLMHLILGLLTLACGTGCTSMPQFIHHPAPTTTLNLAAFAERGCLVNDTGEIGCANVTEITRFCQTLYYPNDILGALSPALPIAGCKFALYGSSDEATVERPDDFLFQGGGLRPEAVRYIVIDGDQVRLVATEQEFRETFAPIESAEEALAYVVATTNLKPRYDITYDPQYDYDVATIEDTHIEATADGWRMNLFDFQVFGCGPHYHQQYAVVVSTNGEVTLGERTNLYRNPDDDQMCVD